VTAIRRVVVGNDADAHSAVILDDVSPHLQAHPTYPGVTVTELWSTRPGDRLDSDEDPVADRIGVRPSELGESRYYSVRIEPGLDIPLHITPTVDYHAVASGEITCVLERSEVTVRAGDVLVIKRAAHGWRTPQAEAFVSFAVMVGAPNRADAGQQQERTE
jgi:quercetin dioxygenase-like cupin family protein